jgi:REP element-mobilizing transposase RayT
MALNDAGKMIEKIWYEIPNDFTNIHLHEYTTMPNHIHGIIEIAAPVGADSISAPISDVGVDSISAQNRAEMDSAPTGTQPGTGLSRIVQSFKRHTTIEYIKMVKQNILPSFDKRVWQRNYWEHIIRNENEFMRISGYIRNNPIMWNGDKLNGGEGNFVMESSTPYNEENWMV